MTLVLLVPCYLSQPLWEPLLGMACGRVKRKTGRREKGCADGQGQSETSAGCPEGLLLSIPLPLGKHLCVVWLAGSWPGRHPGSSVPEQQIHFLLPAKGASLGFGTGSLPSTARWGRSSGPTCRLGHTPLRYGSCGLQRTPIWCHRLCLGHTEVGPRQARGLGLLLGRMGQIATLNSPRCNNPV